MSSIENPPSDITREIYTGSLLREAEVTEREQQWRELCDNLPGHSLLIQRIAREAAGRIIELVPDATDGRLHSAASLAIKMAIIDYIASLKANDTAEKIHDIEAHLNDAA